MSFVTSSIQKAIVEKNEQRVIQILPHIKEELEKYHPCLTKIKGVSLA